MSMRFQKHSGFITVKKFGAFKFVKFYLSTILCFSMLIAIAVAITFTFTGCVKTDERTVVIYTSVDQVFSEKLFKTYEQETGVKVKAVYDIEAQKTVGLVNRLISEKENPQADVFWNGEILQTILLKEKNILDGAIAKNSKNLPKSFVDKDNMWFGFGGRARVLIFNKTMISKTDLPKKIEEFGQGPFASKTGLAYPIFGTASTHAAALYSFWGKEKARTYYENLKKSGVAIVDGNGAVKDDVSARKLALGLTDTDDALSEMAKNKDLDIAFLDQRSGEMGNLVIPNTVAKIKNGPNSKEADLFINYLLSAKSEQALVDDGWIQIPVNKGVKANPVIEALSIKIMNADFNETFKEIEVSKTDLTSIFIR